MPRSSWQLRGALTLTALAMLLLSAYAGFRTSMTPEDASALAEQVEKAQRELYALGSPSGVALQVFITEAAALLACSAPGVGVALAAYLTYEAGRYARALEVAGVGGEAASPGLSDVLHILALSVAAAESLYLAISALGRRRWEPLETASVIVLELSVAALIGAIEAALQP